jgi:hypothetical protein
VPDPTSGFIYCGPREVSGLFSKILTLQLQWHGIQFSIGRFTSLQQFKLFPNNFVHVLEIDHSSERNAYLAPVGVI